MSTPPDRSTLSNYAANKNSQANKAQAGAVAVTAAIGSTLARGAASWLSNAVSTVSEHVPAARSATQYYTYDASRASAAAYKRAKSTIAGAVGGAAKASTWMGLDLTDPITAAAGDINTGEAPLSAESGGLELLPGFFVPGEAECHYTPRPTGLAGQVEIARVQVQLAPVFVSSPELFHHSSSNSSGSASAAASFSTASDNENAMLCLSLVGPGGYPGFAIFRVDCTDVYEEVVELNLTELEALGPVKSVCVAEAVVPSFRQQQGQSTSAAGSRSSGGGGGGGGPITGAVHQKFAVILTEKCILQYNIAQRKVVSFQALAFEAADLKLSSYFALVVHSGFGQVSVLSLYGKNQMGSGSGAVPGGGSSSTDLASPSRMTNNNAGSGPGGSSASSAATGGGGGGSSRSTSSSSTFCFALDELDVLVPDSDELALCDRWIAYVGSGSDAARSSTRLLSYAQRTTTENISKNIYKGVATVGGFLGAAVNKAMQVSGVAATTSSPQSGGSGAGGSGSGTNDNDFDDGLVFNPRAVGAQPIDSSDKSIGTVVVRDLFSRTDIAAFVAHDNPIQTMAFDSTGTMLATCANDGKHIHVFRVCPRGSATRSTTVAAAAAAVTRGMPMRLPSAGSSQSLYGLAMAAGGGGGGGGSLSAGTSQDDITAGALAGATGASTPTQQQQQMMFPSSSFGNGSAPCTTVIFTHRIARGMTGGTVTALSFSQPWSWLACTTTVGTAHFFRLNLDRLCNVEENIIAGESGLQPAVNVAGASFRIRSAPATSPPNPVVCFFPGEAATGAGEQTTACVVTKSATVATTVVSSVSDKGVVLYEKGAAQFSGPNRDGGGTASKAGGGGGARGGKSGADGSGAAAARYMTAEAAWMELLHRRTQPAFAPLYTGVKVQPLPQPESDEEEEDE